MRNLLMKHLDLNSTATDYFDNLSRRHPHSQHPEPGSITLPRGNAPIDSETIPKVLLLSEREENRQWIRAKLEKDNTPFVEVHSVKKALDHLLHEPIKMLIVNCDKNIHNICDLFEKADAALPPNEKLIIPFRACSSCKKCEMTCAKSLHFKLVS